jgi:hypothetical protein
MSDYTVYATQQELREALSDINDLLSDFDKTQASLDEQRGVLADQVQGALAVYEKQVSDYEQRRDDLDLRQSDLNAQRKPFDEARERLQQQVDAKLGKQTGGNDRGAGQANAVNHATGPTTREQIDNLKAQLSKPQIALQLNPPGAGASQASTIDKDLKLMAKIKEKEQKMDNASQKLKDDWNQSKGPKR